MKNILQIAKRTKAAIAVICLLAVAFVVFGALIGMPSFGFVVIALLIGLPTVLFAVKRGSSLSNSKLLTIFFMATVVTLLVIQLIPYGKDRSNDVVTAEPAWATPQTRELMVRACFGCHSNEVEYPAYASVSPISWAVQSHIDEGREKVNYQEWDKPQRGADETIETIEEGEMPPHYYTVFGRHPEAKLTPEEINVLVAGLLATGGMSEND
jgi:mono/diheme cytochrome c family protein